MKYSLGYITTPTKTEAKDIVLELLERQLIACANILPAAESYYVWEDEIDQNKEIIIIVKTHQRNEAKIIKVVDKMHPYECPCIVFVPLSNGNSEYLRYIRSSC